MSGPPPPPKSVTPQDKPAPTRLEPGTVIAERYQIIDVLGVGSMGIVYTVEHLLLKKKMAIKILHPELKTVKSLAIRFEREAMATAKIDHPNMVAAVDFGQLGDGALYFALELVEGRSLRSEIASGPLPLTRALHIARQIASLLGAAQPLGIVHRDLKPENVMLVHRGEDPDFVKVLDFGIARIIDPDQSGDPPVQALTKVGAVFGTPEYMAPEQALGQRVDTRADLYSLGVMLFEMIAGVRPYGAGIGQSGILAQQITAPRPSFAEVAPQVQVPEAVERVVNRLLAKGVAERYQRASDVVQALEGLLDAGKSGESIAESVAVASEALPAFELSTQVPGLTDLDRPQSSAWQRLTARTYATVPQLERLAALTNRKFGPPLRAIGSKVRAMASRHLGSRKAGVPPMAMVTFGVGLLIGLVVAVGVWIASSVRHRQALEEARAAVSAAVLASAAASPAVTTNLGSAGATSAVGVSVDGKDPESMIAALQAKLQQRRDSEAVTLAVKLLSRHPDRRVDGRIGDALYRLANSNAKDAADTAFALLEGTMATKGADIIYQLWLDKAVRETARRRAERWIRGEQFTRSASNALLVATRLRLAESCEKKHEMLALAAKGGTSFALQYLKELSSDKGCGIDGNADCFPCMRSDNQLRDAIAQIESRLSKLGNSARSQIAPVEVR